MSELARVHFVDFAVQRAAADAEFFRCRGDIAFGRGQCLQNQFSFRFMQIERAGFFAERFGRRDAARQRGARSLAHSHWQIPQRDFWSRSHDHAMLDGGA